MKCAKCGHPLEEDTQCPYCAEDNVRVMSRAEKDSYDGITIEADENASRRQEEQQDARAYQYGGQRVYVRHVNLGQVGWTTKLIVGLAILGLGIFFLPLALAIFSIGIVLWLLSKILR